MKIIYKVHPVLVLALIVLINITFACTEGDKKASGEKLDVKAFAGAGDVLDIKALTAAGEKLDVKAFKTKGDILDIKALTPDGKKLDVKTFTPSGEVLHVKAIVGPKGDVLNIKALSLKDLEK